MIHKAKDGSKDFCSSVEGIACVLDRFQSEFCSFVLCMRAVLARQIH